MSEQSLITHTNYMSENYSRPPGKTVVKTDGKRSKPGVVRRTVIETLNSTVEDLLLRYGNLQDNVYLLYTYHTTKSQIKSYMQTFGSEGKVILRTRKREV